MPDQGVYAKQIGTYSQLQQLYGTGFSNYTGHPCTISWPGIVIHELHLRLREVLSTSDAKYLAWPWMAIRAPETCINEEMNGFQPAIGLR
jgi:hypothetical protein